MPSDGSSQKVCVIRKHTSIYKTFQIRKRYAFFEKKFNEFLLRILVIFSLDKT